MNPEAAKILDDTIDVVIKGRTSITNAIETTGYSYVCAVLKELVDKDLHNCMREMERNGKTDALIKEEETLRLIGLHFHRAQHDAAHLKRDVKEV